MGGIQLMREMMFEGTWRPCGVRRKRHRQRRILCNLGFFNSALRSEGNTARHLI